MKRAVNNCNHPTPTQLKHAVDGWRAEARAGEIAPGGKTVPRSIHAEHSAPDPEGGARRGHTGGGRNRAAVVRMGLTRPRACRLWWKRRRLLRRPEWKRGRVLGREMSAGNGGANHHTARYGGGKRCAPPRGECVGHGWSDVRKVQLVRRGHQEDRRPSQNTHKMEGGNSSTLSLDETRAAKGRHLTYETEGRARERRNTRDETLGHENVGARWACPLTSTTPAEERRPRANRLGDLVGREGQRVIAENPAKVGVGRRVSPRARVLSAITDYAAGARMVVPGGERNQIFCLEEEAGGGGTDKDPRRGPGEGGGAPVADHCMVKQKGLCPHPHSHLNRTDQHGREIPYWVLECCGACKF